MDKQQAKIIAELYDEFFGFLCVYAKAALHDKGLAEEAVQETFRIACGKAKDLLDSANPRGWLILTLRNVCRHMYRSRKKIVENLAEIAFSEEWGGYEYDDAASAPEFWYGDLTQDKDFELLRRFAVDRCSLKELAAEYGITLAACKQRISRARRRFQAVLAKEEKKT